MFSMILRSLIYCVQDMTDNTISTSVENTPIDSILFPAIAVCRLLQMTGNHLTCQILCQQWLQSVLLPKRTKTLDKFATEFRFFFSNLLIFFLSLIKTTPARRKIADPNVSYNQLLYITNQEIADDDGVCLTLNNVAMSVNSSGPLEKVTGVNIEKEDRGLLVFEELS